MSSPRAKKPFRLVEFHTLPMSTGLVIRDASDLLEAVHQMSDSVLSRHMIQCYLRAEFDVATYPNDFARWAAESLQEPALAEALSAIDPYHTSGWEDVRRQMEEILEEDRWQFGRAGTMRGRYALHLEDAVAVSVETDTIAHDLDELRDVVEGANVGSIFHHVHGGTFRSRAGIDDFAFWVDTGLGLPDAAAAITGIDFPYYTLDELKRELLVTLDTERQRAREQSPA